MIKYSEFQPTGFDTKGLALDEQQDWLVAPVGQNRDSDVLTRSNWEVVTTDLYAQTLGLGEQSDVEVHRFGHWACGWFEVCVVRPGSKAAEAAEQWENALADYPVADENHYSDLEYEETCAYWTQMSLKERVRECSRAGVSIFAARRDDVPEKVYSILTER